MDTSLINNYVIKAIDAYPFDLEETIENLNYALAYDPNNAYALYLMGQFQAEIIGDYDLAKQYYAEALANKMEFQKVYSDYILVLIWNEDYKEAQKLIDFTFSIKGLNKGGVWLHQGQLFESCLKFKESLKALKKAKKYAYNNQFIDFINSEVKRVENKLKPKKVKKKTKGKKKKKSKK